MEMYPVPDLFLGHIVSEEGIRTDPDKISTIQGWTTLKTAKQLKSFLGLSSYYRRYVKYFENISRPLHKICIGKGLNWTEQDQDAFERLKQSPISPPVLTYPTEGTKFILDTDASNVEVGAVLPQVVELEERVIAYMSKSLNIHEESCCTTRQRTTCCRHCTQKLPSIPVRPDHTPSNRQCSLCWMRNMKNHSGQEARWLEVLENYNLRVSNRSGQRHGNADALRRVPASLTKDKNI